MVGGNCHLLLRLNLPDVFDLLHHANQVSPLFALEAVVGVCVCVCVLCIYVPVCSVYDAQVLFAPTVFMLIERWIQFNGRNSIIGVFTNPI